MRGPSGVKSTPRLVLQYGTGDGSRLRAFSRPVTGSLVLLAGWWLTAGSAFAASYPPAMGCAVSGNAPAGAGVLEVRGMGFRAGSAVLVSVAGLRAGRAVADRAGSFEAGWLIAGLTSGATVTATDASCTVTSVLSIENHQSGQGNTALPPATPGGSSAPGPATPTKPAKPAKPAKPRPAPVLPGPGSRPEPAPPARQSDPVAAAIPSIPLTGLPPQLFLGLAGALLLAGVGLTGLTGRLGHRGERRPAPPSAVSSTLPATRGNA